jgi:WD repeat-containing protein mio
MNFQEVKTAFPELRQLCLAICGWALPVRVLEVELSQLEKEKEFTKAAGIALFHGFTERAIKALSKGGHNMKMMSTAIAGYHGQQANGQNSQVWKDLCHDLSSELNDPYSRAIFAFVSNGDWNDVIEEMSLPLKDRLGVALRYLSDEALTNYLNDLETRVVDAGDLEGIVLTGITQSSIVLLQKYVDMTGDFQTATLVGSFCVPLYFQDLRFHDWRYFFRQQLNFWKQYHARCFYDIGHTDKSRTRDGRCLLKKPPPQIHVRCMNCDKSIAHNEPLTGEAAARQENGFISPSATSCPHCGAKFPRCAVCMLWLGMPDNERRAHQEHLSSGLGPADSKSGQSTDPLAGWFNFCLMCNHGMHAEHARMWHNRHKMCAVPECQCVCARH